MQKSPSDPIRPGDLVDVRRRRWRVVDVRAHEACQVLSLAGEGPDLGAHCRVITPFDRVDPIVRPAGVRLVSRRLWRRACRALIAGALPPGALRSGASARMDLLPHQLEPALAIAGGAGCRLLLADAVGLGKTIQAALVLSELRARGAIDRALILTPAGLRDQWARELSNRVGVAAEIADAREMRRRLAVLPVGENPWSMMETAIASFDYVKRAEILPIVSAVAWDLVIVDEAHNVAGSSDRHGAVAALAGAATYVLLLTATPHNGDRRAFLSLCAISDRGDPLLLFRRSRDAVRIGAGRRVRCLAVRPNGPERRMHALVARLTRAVRADHADTDVIAWLALTVLHKRALSSARSLVATVERRLAALASGTPDADDGMRQLTLPLPDPDGEENEADRPPDLAGLALADRDRERTLLRQLAEAARRAAEHETKVAALARFLARVAEPVIVFTEYRDTLLHVHRAVPRPAAILHGGLTRDERAAALEDFVSGRRSLLLATDAASEGLNLHERCRIVINLELPWNPMRLEQRIGRVDRIGQLRTVHALHLIAHDTGESRILRRLRERVARAKADVGAADPLGAWDDEREAARLVIGGVDPRDEDAAPLPPGTAPIEVPFEAEARAEVRRLTDSRRWMRDRNGPAGFLIDGDRTWLMFARGRTRTALGDSLLLLFRLATEDARGRMLDSALVPVMVPWPRPLMPRADAQAVRRVIEAILPRAMEAASASATSASWAHASADLARAFIAARVSRDRAIAEAAASRVPAGVFQTGLFDHRADQAHRSACAAATDATADRLRRFAAAEESAGVVARTPQLLLVLAP
jgi:superfamily II DNA or RNA helicase